MKADLKAGLLATVSPRALIILFPIRGSFAQKGTKPHLNNCNSRGASPVMTGSRWVGAMLKRGEKSKSGMLRSICANMASRSRVMVYLPHMVRDIGGSGKSSMFWGEMQMEGRIHSSQLSPL